MGVELILVSKNQSDAPNYGPAGYLIIVFSWIQNIGQDLAGAE